MTYIVHIDFGRHESRDFEIRENPARSHEDAAMSLCRMVGGLRWELR